MDTQTRAWRKASDSNPGGNCLEAASFWRKASYSGGDNNCVETATFRISTFCTTGGCIAAGTGHSEGHPVVAVRDTKRGDKSPILGFSPEAWRAFTRGIKNSTDPAIVC